MNEQNGVKTEDKPGFLREVWEFFKIIVISLAIVIPIRYFIVQPFIVRGDSMEPTYEDGEYLVIDEATYYFRQPERGEVIVFRYPLNPSQFFIKRIIGLPGETVEIRGGRVYIKNSEKGEAFQLDEPYLPSNLETIGLVEKVLGKDEFFVLGDNRNFSSDSRQWGVLPRRFLVGRTIFRAWPISRFGFVYSD